MANDFSAFIPELWAEGVLRELDKLTLAMPVMANTDYEGTISAFGDTVHVQTVEKPTVRDYAPGVPITYESLSPTDETLVIDQKKYIAFDVDDIEQAQAKPNIRLQYEERGGQSWAEHFDRYLFGHYSDAHSSNQISNSGNAIDIVAGTAGSTHVYNLVVEAGKRLDENDVSQDGRWMIVTPYMKSLFLVDTVYFIQGSSLGDMVLSTANVTNPDGTRRGMTASEAARRGFIGQVGGFDIYCSNNLPSVGGNYYCPFGQGKPVSFAAQIPPNGFEAGRRESQFGWGIRSLGLYGSKVFGVHAKRLGYVFVDNS